MMTSQDVAKIAAEQLNQSKKAPSSKYDFIKIKVWLKHEHYYILSRFLISRMLTVTKVPQDKAVKISLDVKKWLVDNDKLDISQEELEQVLFDTMRIKGFGEEYIQRFRMVNRFQQQKRPLIVLICGSACTGKSTLAQHLASRLNLPNVLQTDALRCLLSGYESAPLDGMDSLWHQKDDESLIEMFKKECRVMRQALDGDLDKCISDGKSIIIEGLHLDPGLYIQDFKSKITSTLSSDDNNNIHHGSPVFVPIVLHVDADDYRIMAEQWMQENINDETNEEELMHRLMALQEYIVSYQSDGDVHTCSVGIDGFQQALDELHDRVLEAVTSS